MKHKNTEITFKRIAVRDYITISYENVLCDLLCLCVKITLASLNQNT